MRTYDPLQVKLVVGTLEVGGFATGSMIRITPLGEGDKVYSGSAGENALVRSRDRRHQLRIRLVHTATANDAFAAHLQAGNQVQPVFVKDLEGLRTHVSAAMIFKQFPEIDYAAEIPELEWVLEGVVDSF